MSALNFGRDSRARTYDLLHVKQALWPTELCLRVSVIIIVLQASIVNEQTNNWGIFFVGLQRCFVFYGNFSAFYWDNFVYKITE